MKNRGYRGVIGYAALLLLFFTQVAYGQDTKGDFTVSGTGTYSFAENVLTVSGGEVTVSTTKVTSQTIKLTGGKLILNGVQITSGSVSPIEVEGTAEIQLESGKENTLKASTSGAAGIHVPPESTVTFTGEGTLTAKNTVTNISSSSGIGGKQGTYSCGTIIFDQTGTVTATGGSRGAGIGTCIVSSGKAVVSGSILIKRGTIVATGGAYAAGIGAGPDGGSGGGVMVVIEGGYVTATGGTGCSGIGSGWACQTPVDVFLQGGTVTADVAPGKNASSLRTVVVGPDVTITEGNTITEKYTNGFVFSGSPKSATVKGNPVFPAGKTLTIDNGEKLTIPKGTMLINKGTITNNGTIDGAGAIVGNIPSGWSGNTAYIIYDPNGGSGSVADTYHKAGEITSFPLTDGLSKEGYTCIGWNSDQNDTTALTSYTVIAGVNTLYAVWIENIKFTSNPKAITGKVGEVFSEVDLSPNVSNRIEVGGVTFAVKSESALPSDFSLAEDGKLTASAPLTEAMSNQTATVTVTPGNGTPAAELTLTFTINRKKLQITPDADQFVYTDEADAYAPTYQVGEAVGGQQPAFSGKLGWQDGAITRGDLALVDNESFKAANYELELSSSPVKITVLTKSLADTYSQAAKDIATAVSDEATNGWHTSSITLAAPTDFKLKAVANQRATSDWKEELTISQEGNTISSISCCVTDATRVPPLPSKRFL